MPIAKMLESQSKSLFNLTCHYFLSTPSVEQAAASQHSGLKSTGQFQNLCLCCIDV